MVVPFALRTAARGAFLTMGALRYACGVVLCGAAIGLPGFVCVMRLVFC